MNSSSGLSCPSDITRENRDARNIQHAMRRTPERLANKRSEQVAITQYLQQRDHEAMSAEHESNGVTQTGVARYVKSNEPRLSKRGFTYYD